MPEAIMDAPAPAAPAAPPSPPPSNAPPISVTPEAVDRGPTAPPPKPGSAKDRLFQDLRKKAGLESGNEPETKPATAPKPSTPDGSGEETSTETTATAPPPSGEASQPTAPDPKKGKVSPWKLVDEHKAARLKAETELAELRKQMVSPDKVKEIEEKAAKLQADYQKAQEELRYRAYEKSDEFAEKYQKPYMAAWQRWMGELGELTVTDVDTGTERPLDPKDILELVNMPLQKAREHADTVFGSFADDVMSARKEIRGLFEAQNKALQDARKAGDEWQKQQVEQHKAQQQKLGTEITEHWKQANDMAVADEKFGKFFKPVEGDEDGNTRLKKGYELADRAFAMSPLDPNLTPEQRKEIVQLHAAVRNRSAAFGRLAVQNESLAKKVATLEAELAKYKSAQPGGGEGRREQPEVHGGSAKDQVFSALRQIAH
jgi:hypothetical protein